MSRPPGLTAPPTSSWRGSSFCRARYFPTYVAVDGESTKYVYDDFTSQPYMVSTTETVYSMDFMRHYDASLLIFISPYSGFEKLFNEMYKYRYVSIPINPLLLHHKRSFCLLSRPPFRNLDIWAASLSDIEDGAFNTMPSGRLLCQRSVADTLARYSTLKMLMLDPAGEVLLGPYPTTRAAANRGRPPALREIYDARLLFTKGTSVHIYLL